MPKRHVRCTDASPVNTQGTLRMVSIAAEVCRYIAARQGPAAPGTVAGLPPCCCRGAVCPGRRDPLPGTQIHLSLHPAAHRRLYIQRGSSQCAACSPDICQPSHCTPFQLAVRPRGRAQSLMLHNDPSASFGHAHDTHTRDKTQLLKALRIPRLTPQSAAASK